MMLPKAMENGLTPVMVKEIVYQAADYVGFGRMLPFLEIANEVMEEKGIELPVEHRGTTTEENRLESQVSDIQRQAFNEKPHHGREVERIVMIRHIRHGEASGNHQGHQPKQRTDIAAEEDEQGENA